MEKQLKSLEQNIRGKRNFEKPPLHLWQPPLSGDIDIRIAADGSWYHEGGRIERESLVRLFASILRREDDGEYYLVTPAEKWRIQVELHPLMVTDITVMEAQGSQALLQATLNTGKTVAIGEQHPLFLEPAMGDIAVLTLDYGLSALFTRAAWYRLVDMTTEIEGKPAITSGDYVFKLLRD
jgi:hypothetical protein